MGEVLSKISGFLWGTPFLLFILSIGLYFTAGSKFFVFTHFKHIMKQTLGSLFSKEANEKKEGQVTPFEAVCIAIGGSVGMGNIGGVATAIAVGGPGAAFWMWLWALFGMMVKLVETALGSHYRSKNEQGEYFGGPTYYMEKGIAKEKGIKFGYVLAIIFGIGFIMQFLGGSQAYTISEILSESFGINMILTTVLYSIILYYVIWTGTPRVAKFASNAVPFMVIVYLLGGIGLIIINIKNVPSVITLIFTNAFTGTAAVGGFTGATVKAAIQNGVSRSMNSNEAGQGASPLIHSSANTIHPVRQGLWGAFEVFIDTIIVCSITAISLLVTGVWTSGQAGATLSIMAYSGTYGVFGRVFIGILGLLFGLTTTSGWFTYYLAIINHALRYKPILRDKIKTIFKFVYPIPNIVIVSAIVLTGNGPETFWTIVDISLVIPVFANLLGLFLLRDKFWDLLKDYKARYMGIGKVDPNFYVFYEDDPEVEKEEELIRSKIRLVAEEAYGGKKSI